MVYGKIAGLVPIVLSGALLFTGCAMMPPEEPAVPEIPGMPEEPVTDNWPESISCAAEGMNGEPLRFELEIEEARTLNISCLTKEGKLRIQIKTSEGKIVFDESEIGREDFEVFLEEPGVYSVSVWAERFYGKFEIS